MMMLILLFNTIPATIFIYKKIFFPCFIIEALTNVCGHFRILPHQIMRLIGAEHGILHTRCFILYFVVVFHSILSSVSRFTFFYNIIIILSVRHHMKWYIFNIKCIIIIIFLWNILYNSTNSLYIFCDLHDDLFKNNFCSFLLLFVLFLR